MKDIWLALRNTKLLVHRSRSFALFVTFTVALALLCGGLVVQATKAVSDQILESSIMRTVEVSSTGVSTPIPLTQARIDEISHLHSIATVQPWIQAGTLATESVIPIPGALWATPRMAAGQPPVLASTRQQVLPLADNEAILPAKMAGVDLRALLGTTITMEYTRRLTAQSGEAAYLQLHVVGLHDEAIGGRDGPAALYLNLATTLSLAAAREGVTVEAFGKTIGYPKLIVEVEHADNVLTVQRQLSDMGYNASSMQSQLDVLPPTVELIAFLGKAIIIGLILACIGAGLTIGANLVRSRLREIGLLKAVGFSNTRVVRLFAFELGLFGLLTASAGTLLGLAAYFLAQQALRGKTLFEVTMADKIIPPSPARIALLLLIPAVAMLIGGIWPLFRAATLQPDVALRDPV